MLTDSEAFQPLSWNAPEPAEWLFSHSWPRSSPAAFASTSSLSTTEPTPADRQLSTKLGAKSSPIVSSTVWSSTALTMPSTFSALQPSWVRMKAGVRLSLITRCREKATSSARTGLPEWKVRPGRILRVIVRPSSLTL